MSTSQAEISSTLSQKSTKDAATQTENASVECKTLGDSKKIANQKSLCFICKSIQEKPRSLVPILGVGAALTFGFVVYKLLSSKPKAFDYEYYWTKGQGKLMKDNSH